MRAAARASGLIGQTVGRQASILAYLDIFLMVGAMSAVGILLAFFIKPFNASKDGGSH